MADNKIHHWEYTECVSETVYTEFLHHRIPIKPKVSLPYNTAVFIQSAGGSKRLEGIYDKEMNGIRPLRCKSAPNRDLRLYLDAINNQDITMVAVDGLMGTGKTSTCIEEIIIKHLSNVEIPSNLENWRLPAGSHRILIAKPHVNAGGENYGHLPGDLDEKLDPTLTNFAQYFDRFHDAGFDMLKLAGYIEVLPLGFIRGLDAQNMTIIVDEAQNTSELISLATRKAHDSKIFFLGDTSTFQIDKKDNTPTKNGLSDIIDLLAGAPYFQYIEMKSLEHIVRSTETRDVVRRLFNKYGKNPQEWVL